MANRPPTADPHVAGLLPGSGGHATGWSTPMAEGAKRCQQSGNWQGVPHVKPVVKLVMVDQLGLRRRGPSACCVRLVGAVALLAAIACGAGSGPSAGTPRPEAAGDLASGRWSALPEPPLSDRVDTAIVWAGDRLMAWGGANPDVDDGAARLDGATWAPDTGWRSTAPAPANRGLARGGFAAWTGREVVLGPVVPESDAIAPSLLAYAPSKDRWRRIPRDPVLDAALGDPARDFRGVVAIVGQELVIGWTGGGEGAARQPGSLVAVDPTTGRSRPLDPGPFDAAPYTDLSGEVLVTPVGDRLLAVPNWAAKAWLLDPSGDGSWTETSPPPVSGLHLNGPVGIGSEAVFPDDSVAFDPAADRWRVLAEPPRDLVRLRLDGGTGPIAAGDQAVSRGGAYDTRSDVWYSLAPLPLDREQVLLDAFMGWTGDTLVVFGGGQYSCPLDATCEVDLTSVDWDQRGWVYQP